MLTVIITLALVGHLVYLVETFIPMPAPFKTAIRIVAGVCVFLYLVQVFGVADLPIPRFSHTK